MRTYASPTSSLSDERFGRYGTPEDEKPFFPKMNFDPKNIFAEEMAEIPLARLWAVPRYYFRCKAESATLSASEVMTKKTEKSGVKSPLEYFWLRPWVPKVLFRRLLDEIYPIKKTAGRYDDK